MARRHTIGELALFDSYHCSRYNTNTGVLTTEMFRAVFATCARYLDACADARPENAQEILRYTFRI